ncbi:MAG: hypothetical protein TE42_08810 [Candidatus Synechococcus spongiarum SP3]|uniref:Uncharacterized protein n=1 Tax=Candidatus Synechococcus spongiarum SP3 TaxID=1604020 RepID=A0A0G2HKJ0_9SYNE|nr:MAG: hypothetical protein TE42_08810 [Candidatus Synechococcus spongiarum SP3]
MSCPVAKKQLPHSFQGFGDLEEAPKATLTMNFFHLAQELAKVSLTLLKSFQLLFQLTGKLELLDSFLSKKKVLLLIVVNYVQQVLTFALGLPRVPLQLCP